MRDLIENELRKERLIRRCAAQRAAISGAFRELQVPIAVADRALGVVRFFRAHPLLLAGAVAAIIALRGRTLAGIATRALAAWRVWRGLGAWAQRFGVVATRSPRPARDRHVTP